MQLQKYKQETKDNVYYVVFTKGIDLVYYNMKLVNEWTTQIHTLLQFDIRSNKERNIAMDMLWKWQHTLNIKNIIWGNCGCKHYKMNTYINNHAPSWTRKYLESFKKEYKNYESR